MGIFFPMELAKLYGGFQRDAQRLPQESVEGIHPEHLTLEDDAEVASYRFGDGVEIEGLVELLLHRGDWFCGDAAGDDQVEVAEVGIYVEGEAMGGDEAGDVDADGG